jgi:hypothetical protein
LGMVLRGLPGDRGGHEEREEKPGRPAGTHARLQV